MSLGGEMKLGTHSKAPCCIGIIMALLQIGRGKGMLHNWDGVVLLEYDDLLLMMIHGVALCG